MTIQCYTCGKTCSEQVEEKFCSIRCRQRYSGRSKDKTAIREALLKTKYNLSLEDYDRMLDDQDGRCAICLKPPEPDRHLCVDHDHETGENRGLLCDICNRGVGIFRDDPEALRRAADYLERTKKITSKEADEREKA